MTAKTLRPICRCCGERWSRLDVMIARVHAWYAWERNRRLVRAWSAAITAYVLVCVAEWPLTGIDPVTLHVVAYGGLVDTIRALWDALTTALA